MIKLEKNKLYEFTWRDCFGDYGWHTLWKIKEHIERYNHLTISGYFVYEDADWIVIATTPTTRDQWLTPTYLPKPNILSAKEVK